MCKSQKLTFDIISGRYASHLFNGPGSSEPRCVASPSPTACLWYQQWNVSETRMDDRCCCTYKSIRSHYFSTCSPYLWTYIPDIEPSEISPDDNCCWIKQYPLNIACYQICINDLQLRLVCLILHVFLCHLLYKRNSHGVRWKVYSSFWKV